MVGGVRTFVEVPELPPLLPLHGLEQHPLQQLQGLAHVRLLVVCATAHSTNHHPPSDISSAQPLTERVSRQGMVGGLCSVTPTEYIYVGHCLVGCGVVASVPGVVRAASGWSLSNRSIC